MAKNFPEEVIMEILSWLPVKSLMRFKCVSKPWLQLLSTDPRFIKLHFTRSIQAAAADNSNPGIIVSRKEGLQKTQFYHAQDFTRCDEVTSFQIPFSNPRYSCFISRGICNDFRLVNVCNGLLCLSDFYQEDDSNCYVWNPLTGDHITLPCSPIPAHFRDEYEDGALFRETDIMFGFGFNEASDEYKVIRFVSTSAFEMADESHSHVSVYTLGEGSWRTLEGFDPINVSLSNPSTALVNGALHWFGSKLDSDQVGSYTHQTLIAFDLQEEVFQVIPQPDGITYGYPYDVIVGELGGLLCIFCRLQHEYVEIWVMKEYGVADSWTREYRIGQPEFSGSYHYLTPLGVANNGDIVISKNTWELILYDPKTNSARDLHKFDFQVFDTKTFKGSLLSPRIINGASQLHD